MPKTLRNVFDSHLTFDVFLAAYKRAAKNKTNIENIIRYSIDLETNIINLINRIKSNKYICSNYHEFTIYEPKERIIRSLPFEDRIVHQWYIYEFIKPFYTKRFIADSYACLEGKGTHKAVKKLQYYIRLEKDASYVLKCDIKKFFDNINSDILFNILKRNIKDKRLLNFTKKIIYDKNEFNGLPIGNYTSQWFANIYLNELDRFVKQDLKVKSYIRYMDDFVLLLRDKKAAKESYLKIKEFLDTYLKLELNKKTKYFPINQGIEFCGYVVFRDYILLRKRNKIKIKKEVNKYRKLCASGKITKKDLDIKYKSYLASVKHCNGYNLSKKIKIE